MVSSFASHQQQLAMMAEEQAHLAAAAASNAAYAGGGTLNLPENAPQSLKANNLSTQNSENAIHELHETKMPEVGRWGRKYKKKTSSSPLGGTKENNIPIEHNGSVGIDGRTERSHMLRERKKSKYLSYPYIDPMDIPIAGRNETKEVSNLELEIESSTSLSEGSKNAQDSRKSCRGLSGRDKAMIKHLTSAELLCELRLAAQNGSYIMESKYFGPLKRFSLGFRSFTFLKLEDDSSQDLSESQLLTKRGKESSDCTGPEERNGCPGTVPDASKSQAADQQQKSKTISGIAEAKPMSRLLDLSNANISTSPAEISKVTGYGAESGNGAVERGCSGTVPNASKSQAANQQQKSKTVSGITEAKPMSKLLDLNANISTSSAEMSKVTGYGATSGNGSVERGCPGTVHYASKSQAADQQQKSKTVSGITEVKPMSSLMDLNANISTSSAAISKVTRYGATSGNGSVERGCPGTVPDASKSQATDQQRKNKSVSGTEVKPMSRLLDLYSNISTSSAEISKVTGYGATSGNGSVEKSCPGTIPDASKSQAADQQRKSKTVSGITEANPMSRLLDLNANISTSSAEISKVTGYGAASDNVEEKSIKTGSACTISNPGLSGLNGNHMTFIQLSNGVQAGVPNLFQSNVQENTTAAQSNSISSLMSRQSETEAIKVESASIGKSSLEAQSAPPGFTLQHGEKWQKLKIEAVNFSANEVDASAPDMNGSVAESNSIREYKQASPVSVPRPEKRGRKRKEEALNIPSDRTVVSVPNMNGMESVLSEGRLIKRRRGNSSDSKVQNNVQQLAAIILNFTSGFSLPSVETIFEAFAGYGILHKPETRFINNSTAQVVFIQSACAKEAFQCLERKNPFGPVLGSYHLKPLSATASDNNLHIQHPIRVARNGLNGLPAPPGMSRRQNGESPNLMFIKQKLEEMTSVLEKAGSNLSPEMRGKLESEIEGLKEKVNSLVGASS